MRPSILKRSALLAAFLMVASVLTIPMTVSAGPVVAMSVSNESTQTTAPGGSVIYNISISNTGDATALVNLSISGTPTTWSSQLSSTQVSVSVGNTVTVYLTVGVCATAVADNVGVAIVVTGKYDSGGTEQTKFVSTTTKVSQIYNFGMSVEGAFNKDIAPGSSGTFTLNVTQVNQGNGVNYINLTPVGQQPDGLTISYSLNPATLQAFSYSTIIVTVYVPPGTEAKQFPYTITGNSQGGGAAKTASIIVNVTQIWDLSLSTTEAVKYVNPDSITTFTVNVNNTGNKADTFTISSVDFLSSAPGWTETHTSSVGPVNPRASAPATIQVYAPANASYPTSMQLRATFLSESNASAKRNITLTAVVNKLNSTYITATPFINTSDPGGTTGYVLEVKNSGNGQSTIDLTLPSFPAYLTPSLNRSSVELGAGASTTVNLTVSVSKSAPVGDSNIIVRATVRDTVTSSNYTIIVRVNQVYNLSIFPSGSYSQHISPSSSAVYGVTVKNTGNGNDTITMATGSTPSGLTVYFDRYSVSLGPDETDVINATVEVAKDTPAATHNIELKGTSSSGMTANTTIIAIIDQHYEVSVTTASAYNNTRPGSPANYTVTVRNQGSGNDTFSITAGGDSPAWVSFSNSSLRLGPGEGYNITVTVAVPANAKKGNVTTIVTATSTSSSRANASVSLTTVVDQTYGVQIWISPESMDVSPGESGRCSVIIKNSGNARDTFFVNLSRNPNNWASLDLSSPFLTLNSDEYYSLNLTVSVPLNAAVAVLTAEVMATSQGDTSVSARASAVATVTAIYNLELIVNNANASGEPTDKVSFDVRVKNTGNTPDNYSLDLTGEKRSWANLASSSIQLPSGGSSTVIVNVTIPDSEKPANHTIFLKVTSLGNTSKSQSVSLTVRVLPKHDLELTSGDFQTKKTGDPGTKVLFNINVTNTGPDQDTIDLTLSGSRAGWAALSQDSVVLASGAYLLVNMTVSVPSNALPENVVFTVTGKLKSTANRTKTLELTVTVGQIYKIELSSLLSENETVPGGTVNYNVKVRNGGTGNDTVQLSALNYSSWVSFSKSSVTLGPESSEEVLVTMTIPSKPLPAMGDYNITIEGKSVGNDSVRSTLKLILSIKQLYGVAVSSNVSVSYVDPGASASYQLTIKNEGNGRDSFSLTKSGEHTDWVTFSSSSITLEGGASSYVTMTVAVPSNAIAQSFNVSVNVKSQGNLSVEKNLTVMTTINLLYGLELTASDTYKELTSVASAYFNMTVRNTGNSFDTFDFEAIGARLDWVSFNTSSVTLGPGNSTVVKVTVAPPWSTPYDKLSGTYTNLIKVTSRGYSFATANVTLTTRIDIRYGLETTWDATQKTTGPGGRVTFNVTIKNTGNNQDTFGLSALTFTTWVTFDDDNISIIAASLSTVMMTVSVPAGQANQDYIVTVEVKSRGNDTKKTTQDIRVTVSERFGVSLSTEDSAKDCGQGDAVVYTVKVKNTGNVLEDLDLKVVEGNYKEWAALSVSTLQLGESEEMEVTVTVRVPSGQSTGTYDVTVKAEVRGHTENFAQLLLSTSVYYGVEMTTKEPKKKGKANEVVTFNVTVKNRGSGNDTFDLSILDPYSSWLVGFDSDLFELAKDKSRLVLVTIRIDKDALMQDYMLSLKVASDGDSTKTATLTLTISVQRTPALKLESPDSEETVRPGQSVSYVLKLTNDGNGQDTFKLKVESGEELTWASLSKESTILAVDQLEELTLTVAIPSDAAAGYYNHTIKVWSSDDESISSTLTFRTRVEAVYNFQLSAEESSLEGKPGDELAYIVKVENVGNAPDSYDVQVRDMPSGWGYNLTTNMVALGSKSKLTLTLIVWITTNYEKARADSYYFNLRLISRGNDTIEKTLALTAVVEQVHGIELTLDAGSADKSIDPYGDDQDFTINVKNTGNGEDTVTFKVTRYPARWSSSYFTFSPTAITIQPGNTTTKQVSVRLSASSIETDRGDYDFDVAAISKDGTQSLAIRVPVKVIKGAVRALTPEDVKLSKTKLAKGELLSVTVTITNAGDADMRGVTVTLYANGNTVASKPITSTIKKDRDAQVVLEWAPDTADEFTLKLAAKYGLEDPVELTLTQRLTVSEAGAALDLGSLTLPLLVVVLILVVIVVAVALSRRRAPPAPPVRPRPPLREPGEEEGEEEMEEGPEEEGAGEEEMEEGAAPPPVPAPEGEAKPRIARIKCPKCGTTKDVTDPTRPLEVVCDSCGARLRIKK
ncbi:MAG: CARDB domain-containing protein [Thermoplasmatota archaeon]